MCLLAFVEGAPNGRAYFFVPYSPLNFMEANEMSKSKVVRLTVEVEAGGISHQKTLAHNIGDLELEAAETMVSTSARVFLRQLGKKVDQEIIAQQLS